MESAASHYMIIIKIMVEITIISMTGVTHNDEPRENYRLRSEERFRIFELMVFFLHCFAASPSTLTSASFPDASGRLFFLPPPPPKKALNTHCKLPAQHQLADRPT